MINDNDYKVAVRCYTFNHAPYIEDALRGFAIQKTTFPVVYCIVDDASTDGESEVIRNWATNNLVFNAKINLGHESSSYGERYVGKLKDNQNSLFVIVLLNENHYRKKSKLPYIKDWYDYAKYHAICEGDDYWIDPLKLQKQVDFMEEHDDCSMVFHNSYKEDADTGKRKGFHKIYKKSRYTPLAHIIRDGGFIPTASIIYRSNILDQYADFPKKCPAGDIKIQTYAALVGKVFYINEIMAVYRLVSTSSTHIRMKSVDKYVSHQNQIIDWYKMVNEYTNHKYEKDIKGAVTFSEARIAIAQRKYYKFWNVKYWPYILNKPRIVQIGIFMSMIGFGGLSRLIHNTLNKIR